MLLEGSCWLAGGNFAVSGLYERDPPADGRCEVLRPGAAVTNTGWPMRIPAARQEVNALGYRGAPRPRGRAAGAPLRIAMLGDSFTYGYGVEAHETVGEYLEDALRQNGWPGAEVLNFGVPGYQIEDMLTQWTAFARRWRPDLVLVYLASGPEDLQRSWCWYSYKRARLGGSRVPERETLTGTGSLSRLAMNAVIWHQILRSGLEVRRDAASGPGAPREVLTRALDGFARASSDAIPFAFVTLVDVATYAEDPRAELSRQMQSRGLAWLQLREAPPPPRIRFDTHLTARGNRMVGEEIARWLLEGNAPGRLSRGAPGG